MQILRPGGLWFAPGTVLPPHWRLIAPSRSGWLRLSGSINRLEIQQGLASSDWTFFYLPESISASAFGFNRDRMITAAMRRLIAAVELRKCNAIEIESIDMRSVCGFPYIHISVHARHIQPAGNAALLFHHR